ncbi:4a-hydroxytetrahydrobiopterin dehydratase [Arthrobacter sp. JSM 101049]|uniref:4a-hydroxytetrahydrobiopterin dehydratase n=1 Tax=Arthrobacter sp. JSM 101049 TaxID=929097 RepID=UPI003566999E
MTDPTTPAEPAAGSALNGTAINDALAALPDWRYRMGSLVTAYAFDTSAAAIGFIGDAGALAEEQNHHPDLEWRYNTVFLSVSSHDAGGEVTAKDTAYAEAVSAAAARSGGRAQPHRHTTVDLGIDTDDPSRIAEFWTRALGYRLADNGDVVDPEGRNPTIWFQVTDTPSDNRFHLDRHVPLSTLDDERQSLRAVGGEGDGARHPSFRIYTDPDGNRVCLCTEVGHMPGD